MRREENRPLTGLFVVYRQITVNDLPVGRSVDETMRLIKAFQYTVSPTPSPPIHHSPLTLCHFLRISTAKSAQRTGPKAPNQ